LYLLRVGQLGIEPLLRALAARDPQEVAKLFQESRQKGDNFGSLEQALVLAVQERLHRAIQRGEKSTRTLVDLLDHLAKNLGGPEPVDGIKLEVACLTWCLAGSDPEPKSAAKVAECAWEMPSTATTLAEAKQQAKSEKIQAAEIGVELKKIIEAKVEPPPEPAAAVLDPDQVRAAWPRLLLAARTKSQALESILRQGKVCAVEGSKIRLEFELGFHKDQLDTKKYRAAFLGLLEETFGAGVNFAATVLPPVAVQTVDPGQSQDSLVQAVEAAVLSLG
jgi:hypothetical protein